MTSGSLFCVCHSTAEHVQVRELPAMRPVLLLAKCLLRQAGCYRASGSGGDGHSTVSPASSTNQNDGSAAGLEVTESTNAASGNAVGGNQHNTCDVSGTVLAHMVVASMQVCSAVCIERSA